MLSSSTDLIQRRGRLSVSLYPPQTKIFDLSTATKAQRARGFNNWPTGDHLLWMGSYTDMVRVELQPEWSPFTAPPTTKRWVQPFKTVEWMCGIGAISLHWIWCGELSSFVVSTSSSTLTGNCHAVLIPVFLSLVASTSTIAAATYIWLVEVVVSNAYIGRGSWKLAGVHHCSILVSSISILLRRAWLGSDIPPATITSLSYIITPGLIFLVGIAGMSCCQHCPVHVLTMLVILFTARNPPMSTRWLLVAIASHRNCGAGSERVLQVFSFKQYTCTWQLASELMQCPPQTYTFLSMKTAVAQAVSVGRSGSFSGRRMRSSCRSGAAWNNFKERRMVALVYNMNASEGMIIQLIRSAAHAY